MFSKENVYRFSSLATLYIAKNYNPFTPAINIPVCAKRDEGLLLHLGGSPKILE